MRYSFTATTTATSVPVSSFIPSILPCSITIQNKGGNKVSFTATGVANVTDCISIASEETISTIITQSISQLSFITGTGTSVVVIETL